MPRRMAYIPPAVTDVPTSSCYLVWLPDDSRYRAAFWGAYSDLAQYWLWDEDDDTRREEITASWLAAIAQTLECADMTCLEDILAELAAIRAAIVANSCCGDYTIVSDSYNTNIVYNQGDAPATWGDGETVADWADWYELVCAQAHQFVDNLIAVAVTARESLLLGTLAINAISAWLRNITFLSLLLDIANTLAQTVWSEMLGTGADSWDNVATNLEAARDDIVCAILHGGDVEQLVGDAVGTVAWTTFYSRVDYETAIAIMYEGGAGGQYLSPDRRTDCDCTITIDDYMLSGGFTTGGLRVWDGDSYEIWQPAIPDIGQPYRAKATTNAGELCFQFTENASGSPNPNVEHNVTIAINGANGSTINYTVLAANGSTIESGSAADNGGFFPHTVTGARFNFTQGGFRYDLYPTYWANITVNS